MLFLLNIFNFTVFDASNGFSSKSRVLALKFSRKEMKNLDKRLGPFFDVLLQSSGSWCWCERKSTCGGHGWRLLGWRPGSLELLLWCTKWMMRTLSPKKKTLYLLSFCKNWNDRSTSKCFLNQIRKQWQDDFSIFVCFLGKKNEKKKLTDQNPKLGGFC